MALIQTNTESIYFDNKKNIFYVDLPYGCTSRGVPIKKRIKATNETVARKVLYEFALTQAFNEVKKEVIHEWINNIGN